VEAILVRIREDYSHWRQARLFRSVFFWLSRTVAVAWGKVVRKFKELSPLVGSTLPVFNVVSSI
jgi:hypothetical protein